MKRTARGIRAAALASLLCVGLAAPAAAESEETLTDLVDILRQEGVIDEDQHADLARKAARKQDVKDWTDRVQLWGDFRARYETFQFDRDGFSRAADAADPSGGSRLQDRDRARYRARLNLSGEVADRATVYFRLVSGGADPRSTNQTLGSGDDFDTDDLRLDLAYATLTPFPGGELPGVEDGYLGLDVGKVPNPFVWKELGWDALLWDNDITLEGGSLRTKGGSGPLLLFANGGVYVVDENSSAKDPKLAAAQLGGTLDLADHVAFGARGSLYHFFSLDGAFLGRGAANAGPGGTGGNFADGLTRRTGSIQVAESSAFLELGHSELFPVLVFASYAHNLSARSSLAFPGVGRQDDAYAVGGFVGDKKRLAKLGLAFVRIEANAFPSMFIDSDTLDGTPNREGYVLSLERTLFENVDLVLKGFRSERIRGGVAYAGSVPGSDRLRGQADLKLEF